MGRYPLRVKRDAGLAHFGDIFVQLRLHAAGAELATIHILKEGRCAPLPGLLEPATKGLLCNPGERCTSLLAGLANASHMRTLAEHYLKLGRDR